jgi:hypothetical protein
MQPIAVTRPRDATSARAFHSVPCADTPRVLPCRLGLLVRPQIGTCSAAGSRERLPATVDHCVDSVLAGRAAPTGAIGDEVLPGRVAVAEGIPNLLAPSREPGLEPAAVAGDAGRGDAVLLGVGETGGQRCHDGLGTANT